MPGYRNRKSDKGQTERPYKNKTKEHTGGHANVHRWRYHRQTEQSKEDLWRDKESTHMDSTQMPQTVTHIACQNQYKKS